MRHPDGYGVIFDPDLPLGKQESDTVRCGHCQHIWTVAPGQAGQSSLHFCSGCDRIICPRCVQKSHCIPFEEDIQRREKQALEAAARQEAHRSYGI